MSTAVDSTNAARLNWHGRTMFSRFVWKEFRMLRGLWLAVAAIGLIIQYSLKWLMPLPDPDTPAILVGIGVGAAVLYAVGAAATSFSVEHEEETHCYLARLPADWWPVFSGKLLVSTLSSVLLACTLGIMGWMMRGPNSLRSQDVSTLIGIFGFGIVEAVAWGTFFSLLIKRPLLAAVMTLVVGLLAVNVAVNCTAYEPVKTVASLTPSAYVHAIPWRLAIVVALFACSAVAARGWLSTGALPAVAAHLRKSDRLARIWAAFASRVGRLGVGAEHGARRRMLARLVWQTWRENWKLLLVPLVVGILLLVGIGVAMGITRLHDEFRILLMGAMPLFVPALYGAMAFYGDQRRGSYRFLAEHAARPRFTWLARHLVWLATLAGAWFLMTSVFGTLISTRMQHQSRETFATYMDSGAVPQLPRLSYEIGYETTDVLRIVRLAAYAALVAYSIGQFFSMVLRSEILAAFIAMLLAVVVLGWMATLCAWALPGWLFLLPLFAGFMLATWIRAPDWIAERNSWRVWLKPALVILAPFLFIAAILPGARLAQLNRTKATASQQLVATELSAKLNALRDGDTPAARQTADMYTRAAERLGIGTEYLLEPWEKPAYWASAGDAAPPATGGDIDEAKIPRDQLDAFKKAKKRQQELDRLSTAVPVNEAIEISQRPECRFHFDARSVAAIQHFPGSTNLIGLATNQTYQRLNHLIGAVAGEPMSKPDQPLRRWLAALKISRHVRSGQPSTIFVDQLRVEETILRQIGLWALETGRTKEELQRALHDLTAEFHTPVSPVEALLADHLLVLDAIEGKELPIVLNQDPRMPHVYLAYLANELPWERKRAARALTQITGQNIRAAGELIAHLSSPLPSEIGADYLRHWLWGPYSALPQQWEIEEPAAATSYLASLEYKVRTRISDIYRACCDNETSRRAVLIQTALAMYRLDHKAYPPQLADLAPAYLARLPLDPYARQPFHYRPAGLEQPLRYVPAGDNEQRLAAHTPVFWSVGAGDFQLRQSLKTDFEAADPREPEGDVVWNSKIIYVFVDQEQAWRTADALVFPLPK